jgi:hypothetical protein
VISLSSAASDPSLSRSTLKEKRTVDVGMCRPHPCGCGHLLQGIKLEGEGLTRQRSQPRLPRQVHRAHPKDRATAVPPSGQTGTQYWGPPERGHERHSGCVETGVLDGRL